MHTHPTNAAALVSSGVITVLLLLWPVGGRMAMAAEPGAAPGPNNHEPATPVRPPQAVRLQPAIRGQVRALTNTSSVGLVERANPAGGYSVDLQGRFKSVPVAIIGEDGQLTIHEFIAPPPAE